MIVLLLPSRGRPENIDRLWASLSDNGTTSTEAWHMVVELDEDDPTGPDYPKAPAITYCYGPRRVLSVYWNDAYQYAIERLPTETKHGPTIYMHAGDDITFRTVGWDEIVRDAFPADGIAFVHGHDLSPNGATLGTHGFLRREWIDTLGYFVPPYFSSDCNDAWLNDVADYLGRRVYVPIITEHHHFAFGKGPLDLTHQERLARHEADGITDLWWSLAAERYRDAAKLRERMARP